MAIYIDDLELPWRGKSWCHMMTDDMASFEELHSFAQNWLSLKRAWFQSDHYDVITSKRPAAVLGGAILVPGHYMVYLRMRQRGDTESSHYKYLVARLIREGHLKEN